MRAPFRWPFAVLAASLLSSPSHATIIVDLSGTNGSNVINYSVTGSITATYTSGSASGGIWHRPTTATSGTSAWEFLPDFDIGNFIANGTATQTLNLSNAVSVTLNGTEFQTLGQIRLLASNSTPDGVRFNVETGGFMPALTAGDIVSWSGSGSFTLSSGTFDSVFNNLGSFTADADSLIVNVSEDSHAVPLLPTSTLFLTGLLRASQRKRHRTV